MKFLQNIFNSIFRKPEWYIMPCEDKDAPPVRYKYQGSKLIVNKEDAYNRAIYVLNCELAEAKKDLVRKK